MRDLRSYNREVIRDLASRLGVPEEEVPSIVQKFFELMKPHIAEFTGRRSLLGEFLLGAGVATGLAAASAPALARTVVTDKYIDLDGQKFYPASKGAYSAIVYKEGDLVIAEDPNGKIIDQGTAGVDDARVIQSAVDYVFNSGGGVVLLKTAEYTVSQTITMKSKIHLLGESMGVVLKAKDNLVADIIYADGIVHFSIENMIVNGNYANNTTGRPINIQNSLLGKISFVEVREAAEEALYLYNCNAISLEDIHADYGNSHGIYIKSCTGIRGRNLTAEHFNSQYARGVYLDGRAHVISGIFAEDCYYGVGMISLHGSKISGIYTYGSVESGINEQEYSSENEYAGIYIDGTGSAIGGKAYFSGYNNVIKGIKCETIYLTANSRNNTLMGVSATTINDLGTNNRIIDKNYRNSGTATFSGDGTTTQFAIAHGLVAEPSKVLVTPLSADASGQFYVTKDATNIYVNYITAPPAGTNNIVLSWYAEV